MNRSLHKCAVWFVGAILGDTALADGNLEGRLQEILHEYLATNPNVPGIVLSVRSTQ
ncbi:MAG: hypothetical protein QF434_08580 [Nitrospinaceae bacterium]|nr:hypothetical protein [Nitrospinaceae bacterium]